MNVDQAVQTLENAGLRAFKRQRPPDIRGYFPAEGDTIEKIQTIDIFEIMQIDQFWVGWVSFGQIPGIVLKTSEDLLDVVNTVISYRQIIHAESGNRILERQQNIKQLMYKAQSANFITEINVQLMIYPAKIIDTSHNHFEMMLTAPFNTDHSHYSFSVLLTHEDHWQITTYFPTEQRIDHFDTVEAVLAHLETFRAQQD